MIDGWRQSLAGRGVLVTGGAGAIGRRVAAMAGRCGALVMAPTRLEMDVGRPEAVSRVMADARPDLVIHMAGILNWRRDPALLPQQLEAHVLGTCHVLEAARQGGVSRVVLVGSAGEYGDIPAPQAEDQFPLPMDPYSVTKLAATHLGLTYDRAFSLPCTVVRPFNVYGPGERAGRLWPSLFALARRGGGEMAFTSGEQVRDFVWVEDVAEGLLRAAVSAEACGQILNLGRGEGHRVRDAVTLALQISGNLVRPLFGATSLRGPEPQALVADTTKLRQVLGWSPPTSLAQGLKHYWSTFSSSAPSP